MIMKNWESAQNNIDHTAQQVFQVLKMYFDFENLRKTALNK